MAPDNPTDTSLLQFYQELSTRPPYLRQAVLRSWLNGRLSYDPRTGKALPTDMDTLFNRELQHGQDEIAKDYLYPIVLRAESAFKAISQNLREKILREHRLLPLYQVRQVDAKAIQWISQRPGRNIKEKLSGATHIKAPIRRLSIDTLENRLLKRFAKVSASVLSARAQAAQQLRLGQAALPLGDELFLSTLRHWLHSEECEEIGGWQPSAPNNALLHDTQYRKIWDAWNKLQNLLALIKNDGISASKREICFLFWYIGAQFYRYQNFALLQQPLSFQYEDFNIIPHTLIFCVQGMPLVVNFSDRAVRIKYASRGITITPRGLSAWMLSCGPLAQEFPLDRPSEIFAKVMEIIAPSELAFKNTTPSLSSTEEVFIALNAIRPLCRFEGKASLFPGRLWVQHWEEKKLWADGTVSAALSVGNENIKNYTWHSLLYQRGDESITAAAEQLGLCLKKHMAAKQLYYFLPEHLNEFGLKQLKSGLRSAAPGCIPLPASISAILYALQVHKKKPEKGKWFMVLDFPNGGVSITPVKTGFDEELKAALPQTEGVFYQRHPTLFISKKEFTEPLRGVLATHCADLGLQETLLPLLGQRGFETEKGRLFFAHRYQWYYIPEIFSVQYNKKEVLDKIRAVVSEAVEKITRENHTLVSFHPNLTFLASSADFALKEENILEGGEILVQMEKKIEAEAPSLSLWEDFLPNLTMHVGKESVNLVENVSVRPLYGKPTPIRVKQTCKLSKGKKDYKFPLTIGEDASERKFRAMLRSPDFPLDKDLSYSLDLSYTYGEEIPYKLILSPADKNFRRIEVEWQEGELEIDYDSLPFPTYPYEIHDLRAYPKKEPSKDRDRSDLLDWVERQLKEYLYSGEDNMPADLRTKKHRFPVYIIWKDGKSCKDFPFLSLLIEEVKDNHYSPDDQPELFYTLACMHRDAPESVYNELIERSRNLSLKFRDALPLGYSLGALDQPWQEEMYHHLFSRFEKSEDTKQLYIAIKSLATAFWREDSLIIKMLGQAPQDIQIILGALIKIIKDKKITENKKSTLFFKYKLSPVCEMLLALLRLREMGDMEIKKLLAPTSPEMSEIIVRTGELSAEDIGTSYLSLKKDGNELDLLEALNLYLKGEDTSGITLETSGKE